MKRFLISAFGLTFVALLTCAQQVTEYFSLEKPLVFNDTEYDLAYTAKPSDIYYNQEYLPAGQTFDDYTLMVTITLLKANVTPDQATQAKIAELDERKKSDKVCNYQSFKRGNERMLDFLVSDAPSGDFTTVEFDVHRYLPVTIDGNKYLMLIFYSERAYSDDITGFLKGLKNYRVDILNQLGNMPIPQIRITDK